ncbi:MAG TPA: DUF4129 domain-containing protein [Intrasporangium sp.]|nr:DUF4129 domain-containing protein [Intrasporangium sp.]
MARRGATGVVGVVTGAAVVMAALVVAASGRSPDLMSRPSTTVGSEPPTTGQQITAVPQETGAPPPVRGWDPDGLFAVLVQVFVVLIILGVLLLFTLAVRDLLRRVAPRITGEGEAGFASPDVPRAVLEGADHGLEALERGAPRNAIVAAWVALEGAAGAAGLPRHPAETSTEFVTRVLRVWDVDPRSLAELAALYREARFSTHPLTEAHRRRAIGALVTIRSDLGRERIGADDVAANPDAAHAEGQRR